eukprot:GEMP01069679.1.p1 GENE.GEMP01069679.1~~GEMP01069679.1.p1  ORF type:complete len:189 (+),score=34.80 GEMP01069679.1:387-953(+)
MVSSLRLPTLWAPVVHDEWARCDAILKLVQSKIHLAPGAVSARDHQVTGRAVVGRLLTGRLASVLQAYMSVTILGKFHPLVFDVHMRASKNFEEYLTTQGPAGPLEMEPEDNYTQQTFSSWSKQRQMAVNDQLKYTSYLISEISKHILERNDAIGFLAAADEIYRQECVDEKCLKAALSVFDRTLDNI